MKKVSALIKISRPINIFQSIIAIFITAAIFNSFPNMQRIICSALTVSFFIAGGNAINDYFDFETDKTNRPTRPLPLGIISKWEALGFSFLLFIIGILFFIPIATRISTLILTFNLLLLIIYTPLIKPTIFLGNLTVSYLLGTTFIFGAEIFGDITYGIIPAFLAFTFNLSRELIKDIEDLKGDKENNLQTLPVKLGLTVSKVIAAILITFILGGCFVPFFTGLYGKYYLIAVMITVEIPLLFVLNLLRIAKEKEDFARISGFMKILVFFGLLSIYFGKF